jgi:ATP-dependent Clp protease ATP-binding subunit ClpA
VATDGSAGDDLQGFSAEARRALQLAAREARSMGHGRVGTEHVLLGLLADKGTPAATALRAGGATLAATRRKVSEAVGPGEAGGRASSATHGEPSATSARATRALGRAPRFARDQQADAVDSDHLLLAVLDVEGTAGQVLRGLGIDIEQLRSALGAKERPTPSASALTTAATAPTAPTAPTALPPQCPSCQAPLDAGVTGTIVPVTGQAGGRDVVLLACPTCGYTLGVTPR